MVDTVHCFLAEDNPGDVYLIREAFSQHKLTVEFHLARDGDKAIQLIAQADSNGASFPIHVFLVDLNLPRRPGSEIIRRIRSSTRWTTTPIIVITSSDSPQDRQEVSALGADYYFVKPSNLEEFMALGGVVKQLLL